MLSRDLPGPILLVANDAGGANILRHMVETFDQEVLISVRGPARKIFDDTNVQLRHVDLEDGIHLASIVLTGSSVSSYHELQAIQLARALGKYSITYLDHWVAYKARFCRNGATYLPDEIWVADQHGLDLAEAELPEVKRRVVPNAFLGHLRDSVAPLQTARSEILPLRKVLYVSEPSGTYARNHGSRSEYVGYTEAQAAAHFFEVMKRTPRKLFTIRFRPHPSQALANYSWLPAVTHGVHVDLSQNSLVHDLNWATTVIGTNSMALAAALCCGREAITAIPPLGPPCILPHSDLVRLEEVNWAQPVAIKERLLS